jgi:hypothetical protein
MRRAELVRLGNSREGKSERSLHIDSDHLGVRREPPLAMVGERHVPGLLFRVTDQGVLEVRAELSLGSRLAQCRSSSGSPGATYKRAEGLFSG